MPNRFQREPSLTIGAVSRLTGIPVDTLRIWERRYGGLSPARTSTNRRRYVQEDVARLMMIKQLVDQGHGVGSVASLPESALKGLLRLHEESAPKKEERGGDAVTVMTFGEGLPFLLDESAWSAPRLESFGRYAGYAEFEAAAAEKKPDVLVAEWPIVTPECVRRIWNLAQRIAAKRVVAVYGFANRETLDEARRLGAIALRGPVNAEAMAAVCLEDLTMPLAANEGAGSLVPPRRFDNETLGRLARIPTALRCECPHHLADLVFRLSAFEAYSLDCENRNQQDAALHAQLHRTTAAARALIESALAEWVKEEGIDLARLPALEKEFGEA